MKCFTVPEGQTTSTRSRVDESDDLRLGKSNNSYIMIAFTRNLKTQAKLIYIIRDRFNNCKNIKKSKGVISEKAD